VLGSISSNSDIAISTRKIKAMKKSKFRGTVFNPENQKGATNQRDHYDDEDGPGLRRFKKSGKRFHRKKTFREEFWEDMPEDE